MENDALMQGFHLGFGMGLGLLVCYLVGLSARELAGVVRMAGEWIGARRSRRRLAQWLAGEQAKVRKIG